MKKRVRRWGVAVVASVGLLMGMAAPGRAAIITNGQLTIDIRDDNGAIDAATFGGVDFFNAGVPVSDFGLQNGTDTSTFVLNDTQGITGQPVTVASNVVTGIYTGGGANTSFTRTYSLVPGLNVLRVSTDFLNLAATDFALSYFDTFDPDQGQGIGPDFSTSTFNDVFMLNSAPVGQARIEGDSQLTVLLGSLDPRTVVASGNPFRIAIGADLNDFFAAPFDGNDTLDDNGTHIGIRTTLGPRQGTNFTYDLAIGQTPQDAQNAFAAANIVTPEPETWAMMGIGLIFLATSLRRKKQPALCRL